jgi:hypothetical protein
MVGERSLVVVVAAEDALAGATLDAAELLDVDVDELAGSGALVPHGRLQPDPAEPAQPAAGQDNRHGRERHRERLRDLGRGHPQLPQRHDRLDTLRRRAVDHPPRRRGAIAHAPLTLEPIAPHPLTSAAHADTGGRGRRRQRPPLHNHPLGQHPTATPAESRVSVKPHPVSSLGLSCPGQRSASKEARMNQRA